MLILQLILLHSGSQVTASPATTSITITTPPGTGSTPTNVRVRADDDPFAPGDFGGGRTNGEVEDYQAFVALPVELTFFRGSAQDCDTKLIWNTASEKNFSHYEVERSTDARSFEMIESVDGRGNEFTETTYSFIDTKANDFNFYRLKMVDNDGTFEYSKTIQVSTDCDDTNVDVNIFPNPISDKETTLNLVLTSKVESVSNIKIIDKLGREVLAFPIEITEGQNRLGLDISNLALGMYSLSIIDGQGKTVTKQFVKVQN